MSKPSYIIFSLLLLLASCSNIDDSDRLIYVKPANAQRGVLIEDFTGQRCVNCPNATQAIEDLQQQYGPDTVIAVSIHSGPLGFHGNAKSIGLATDLGDTYYNYWKCEYQPVGMINRGALSNFTEWPQLVRTSLATISSLSLKADISSTADNSIRASIHAEGTQGNTQGKLQVWLIEDSITALQMMPDGTANYQYQHNHVFRASMNGEWGDDFALNEGETKGLSFSIAAESAWQLSNLRIVAFVYNAEGVIQVARSPRLKP